jgi:hypothetical protein
MIVGRMEGDGTLSRGIARRVVLSVRARIMDYVIRLRDGVGFGGVLSNHVLQVEVVASSVVWTQPKIIYEYADAELHF